MQHIVAPFNEFAADAWHEDIWHAFRLAKRFENQQCPYQLWSPEPLSESSVSKLNAIKLAFKTDILHIQPYRGIVPDMGNLWIMGDTRIGPWYDYHQFDTVSACYDSIRLDFYFEHLHRLRKKPANLLRIIHVSKDQAKKSGLAGTEVDFHLHEIDFWRESELTPKTLNSTFTIGRISPDFPEWHHFNDPLLYNLLT